MNIQVPSSLLDAWRRYGDPRAVVGWEETSPGVSTNRVVRLDLDDGSRVFAKASSYGSYVHFRQDHRRIQQWRAGLAGGPFAQLLAAPLSREDGEVFTVRFADHWVVFYEEARRAAPLPKVLHPREIDSLAEQMASLHEASLAIRPPLAPTWQTMGSDLALLFDKVGGSAPPPAETFSRQDCHTIEQQCDRFFSEAERLGYHDLPHIAVLVDWNRGNFSVEHDSEGRVRLFSRWDYDWFRVEPRMLDFYFLARLVRAEGDQTAFTYSADPLFEERFVRFLRCYREVSPLGEGELLFLREAYRFFLLNYVISKGAHFFAPALRGRLMREALERHLPLVDDLPFEALAERVLASG